MHWILVSVPIHRNPAPVVIGIDSGAWYVRPAPALSKFRPAFAGRFQFPAGEMRSQCGAASAIAVNKLSGRAAEGPEYSISNHTPDHAYERFPAIATGSLGKTC